MNRLFKFFSYKKVATLIIQCTIPHQNTGVIQYKQKCHLYENKNRDRKCSLSLEWYPMSKIDNIKLIKAFLNNQCTPSIPSYEKIKHGEKPIIIHATAAFY